MSSKSRALAREKLLYEALLDRLILDINKLQATAENLALLDVCNNLAERASTLGLIAPKFSQEPEIHIEQGRHLVIEQLSQNPFISNDMHLDNTKRMLIITGPNMGGKSTYMRQTALIVLMAYIGSYVPAKSALIGKIDRIFTRIGASDDLTSGRSTFMLEMTETANILHNATPYSLVLMDEIGRGTSTFDGLSLAWACAIYLAQTIRAFTLFSTHYFELTQLPDTVVSATNVHLQAMEYEHKIVFLHSVKEGPASQSYGLQVAELAGIPSSIINAAKHKLKDLEANYKQEKTINPCLSNNIKDSHPLILVLQNINPDALTPREALEQIYHLKNSLKKLMILKQLRNFFIGLPRNPFDQGTRKSIALIAFLAWVGLGADGLSSSAYGPEEAFLALGQSYHLAFYLAILTGITVFVISLAYNQVIELFPSGGGGYKVASILINPQAGLISGSALIVDYILTISISIASGIDALFSFLPLGLQPYKIIFEVLTSLTLLVLNLRGIKESIKILMPIFVGFVITHFILIVYGISSHGNHLPLLIENSIHDTKQLITNAGWFFVLALLLRAYSLGGGTYTGIEAVSNNVNHLAEPRVKTGKWTMFYMALSLSFTAAGIILLYLLWDVKPVEGQTLNAVVFKAVIGNIPLNNALLVLVLILESCLLFVAANTGFLGGPAVLANMAIDGWIPKRFRSLSSRLVTQNGIVFFGLSAIVILLITHGEVSMLVVLYSMNVFLTFSLSLLGLCIYWWRHRTISANWLYRMALSSIGLLVCCSILIITLLEKFTSGGWLTVVITSAVVLFCIAVKKHYAAVEKQVHFLDQLLTLPLNSPIKQPPTLDYHAPTAVFMIGDSRGEGMHTLLWVQRMFPGHFKNFVFISVGVVDVGSYGSEVALEKMQEKIALQLQYFIDFSHQHGFAATSFVRYNNDPVEALVDLAEHVSDKFHNCVFFAASLISKQDNWFHRKLHSDIPAILQRHLHLKGLQMVILPVKLER